MTLRIWRLDLEPMDGLLIPMTQAVRIYKPKVIHIISPK